MNAGGADLSFYQGIIDFAKMKLLSDFVIIRAGQNYWIDSMFYLNWTEAK